MKIVEDTVQKFATNDFYLILMHYVQSIYIKVLKDINSIKHNQMERIAGALLIIIGLLLLKYKELYSVLGSLIKKLLEEFDISIEIMEKFKVEFTERKVK